jgi:hypothetical protein
VRVTAVIEDRRVVEKTLHHLGAAAQTAADGWLGTLYLRTLRGCGPDARLRKRASVTIDTNPARAFTRSSRKAASSQILLPGRQALGHEAEEFGEAAAREVGQGHGLKQRKSVRTRYLDNLAVRG